MDLLGLKNVTKFGPDTSKRCEKNKRLAGPDFFVYGKGFVSCNYKNPLAAKGDGSEIADRSISLLLSSDVQNSSATPDSLVPRFRQCQDSALRCQSDIQERRDGRTSLSIAAAPPPICRQPLDVTDREYSEEASGSRQLEATGRAL